jgi:ribosomal-protein-alanine N-acetyltransferase
MTAPDALRLRPLTADHLEGVYSVWSDPEVVRFTNWSLLSSREDCAKRVDRILERYREGSRRLGPFCILGAGERFLGLIGLDAGEPFNNEHELWYLLRRDCWGRGIGKWAVAETMGIVRSVPEISRLVACAVASNAASWRILEMNGFRRSGVVRDGFDRGGQKLDLYEYEFECGPARGGVEHPMP